MKRKKQDRSKVEKGRKPWKRCLHRELDGFDSACSRRSFPLDWPQIASPFPLSLSLPPDQTQVAKSYIKRNKERKQYLCTEDGMFYVTPLYSTQTQFISCVEFTLQKISIFFMINVKLWSSEYDGVYCELSDFENYTPVWIMMGIVSWKHYAFSKKILLISATVLFFFHVCEFRFFVCDIFFLYLLMIYVTHFYGKSQRKFGQNGAP